ncbi:MAG: GAF and ANTAR domain-containing protein [Actinomycetota bacterium]|nr:GAF and ANTAR domain-containing protein [Actinomycetota bacterium]
MDGSPAHDDPKIAETFAHVARLLVAEHGVERTLARIGELAVQTIDGCDHAGTALIQRRQVTTAGASDEVSAKVDAIQCETGQGPCLDAMRDHEVFQVDCLAEEQGRWPAFGKRAVDETGVCSILAFRLFAEEDTMGALNLYSRRADAFDDEARELGSVFAAHAAVALSHARKEDQLEEAMKSRDVIGQAKGLLMARQGMTSDQAFEALRRASQRLNIKLREVAERVVAANNEAGTHMPPLGPRG